MALAGLDVPRLRSGLNFISSHVLLQSTVNPRSPPLQAHENFRSGHSGVSNLGLGYSFKLF